MRRIFFWILVLVLGANLLYAQELKPIFYLPFEGNVTAQLKDNKVTGLLTGNALYGEGIQGKALKIQRYAYDQVTTLHFSKLPELSLPSGTLSFWFKPNWDGADSVRHNLIYYASCYNKQGAAQFRFYFVKNKKNGLDLSICVPGQHQIYTQCDWQKDKWVHIAFSWDIANDEMKLYEDGKLAAAKVNLVSKWQIPGKIGEKGSLWFGNFSTSNYEAIVGDGMYDEFKVFNRVLGKDEIFLLFAESD